MSEILPVIYNPTAGAQGSRKLRRALKAIEELGYEAELLPTSGIGSATELARRASEKGMRRLAVAGGDGTINEVVNGIVGGSSRVDNGIAANGTELAVIPTGTANVLAIELGIPLKVEEAAKLAVMGKCRSIDLGLADGRYFTLMAGVGFDALVIKNLNPVLKKSIRRAAFPVTGVLTLMQKDLPLIEVRSQGRTAEGYFVVVSNSRYYGGRFGPNPKASITDGLLDVCVLKGKSFQEMLNFWVAALKKEHLDEPFAEYFRSSEVEVSCPRGTPVPVQTDGEVVGELPMRIAVKPGALKVCAGGGGET